METSKTFLVTITYDTNEKGSHQFTDENLSEGLKFVTEASFQQSVDVNARRVYVPEEIQQPESDPIMIH